LKNVHRIIAWVLSIIDKESTWSRHYGGRHTDFTLSGSELIPLDPAKVESVVHPQLENYLIAPSKGTVLLLDVIQLFQQLNISVHIEGPAQSGKSSLLTFISKKYSLNIEKNPHDWS
jgi:hypothetical protein